MPLKSDIVLDAGKFDPANVSEQANIFNEALTAQDAKGPKWYEVGAAKSREMALSGGNGWPIPPVVPEGINSKIPSRETGRDIPTRVIYPPSRKTEEERQQCKGTVMHIHGGGWTLGSERSYDMLLLFYANASDLAVVSIGYRLAPEDPFPKGPEDCLDAGEYLFNNSQKEYGGPLRFIGGESAGGHLSLLTTFHLLKTFPTFTLSGLLLHFGAYDLSHLPAYYHLPNAPIIPVNVSDRFVEAFLPGTSVGDRKNPNISPLYEDLSAFRGRLPSALFTCGTVDSLIDDSVVMGTKWLMAGGEAYVKIYNGAPHAFIAFPPDKLKEVHEAMEDTSEYIKLCMARV